LRPALEKAALTLAVADSWAAMAALAAVGILISLCVRRHLLRGMLG
jgi:hypothetical protein